MLVSIIIPAYNASPYIDKCLYQIINQTYKNFEVIIVNDGSTDDTLKILKNYQKKYTFIKLINQKNSGQAVARNKAIDLAIGEYITFVDIDDFIDTTFLEEMVNVAESSKADVIYSDYYEYYSSSNLKLVKNDIHPVLANYAPWAKLYKRSFFNQTKLRFLEGKLFEDIAIVPVLAGIGKTAYLPLPLYYYNKSNISSIRRKEYNKKLEDVFDAIDEVIYNFKKHKIYNKYKQEIEYMYLDSFLRGSVMRFADFKEGITNIYRVREKVLAYFPNILDNKYYRKSSFKEKILYRACIYMNPSIFSFLKRTKGRLK